MSDDGRKRWDFSGTSWETGRQRLWRRHSDAVNCSLLERWLPEGKAVCILKTDLFDEMCSEGLLPLLAKRSNRIMGMDVSHATIRTACSRHAVLQGVSADVRRLPFRDEAFDLIISNSTLDHFESHESVAESLAEIFRILRQNGQLILTMDNLLNPAIAIRNALPFLLLKRMRLIPYYVGATWGPRGLRNQLLRTGFGIVDMDAVLHCPRVLAVAAASVLETLAPRGQHRIFFRILSFFEMLRYLPTRFVTGGFVAVRAVKQASTNPSICRIMNHDPGIP
jgi:SAM-dependent methyltransferase